MFNLIVAIFISIIGGALYLSEEDTKMRMGFVFGLLFGCFITMNLVIGTFNIYGVFDFYDHNRLTESKLIQECEATLPRNKKCVIEMKAVVQ